MKSKNKNNETNQTNWLSFNEIMQKYWTTVIAGNWKGKGWREIKKLAKAHTEKAGRGIKEGLA